MPRYYFHIQNGSDLEEDPEGTELPDINAAHAEALIVTQELAAAVPEFDSDTIIEFADEMSQTVLLVPFSEAIGPIQ